MHEMEVINQFQENYEFVNFVSINLDFNLKSYKKVAEKLYKSWPVVYPLNKQKFNILFSIRSPSDSFIN